MQSVYAGTPWIIAKITFLLHGELTSSDDQILRKKCKKEVEYNEKCSPYDTRLFIISLFLGFTFFIKHVNLGLISHCAMVMTAMRESLDIT